GSADLYRHPLHHVGTAVSVDLNGVGHDTISDSRRARISDVADPRRRSSPARKKLIRIMGVKVASATRSPRESETKPISGGSIRKLVKETSESPATLTAAGRSPRRAAALIASGTATETPRPVAARPKAAWIKPPAVTSARSPTRQMTQQ